MHQALAIVQVVLAGVIKALLAAVCLDTCSFNSVTAGLFG